MPKFRVPVSWCMQGFYEISSKSYKTLIEAIDRGDYDHLPHPKHGELIQGSLQFEDYEDALIFDQKTKEWVVFAEEE